PDVVVVQGDTASVFFGALVGFFERARVAHVEAGLRSGDMAMPEEINRIVTDSLSDWFFVTEPAGVANLKREGQPDTKIFHVGHVMVDNVVHQARQLDAGVDTAAFATDAIKRRLLADPGRYGVVTLHRPSNVDAPETLAPIAGALKTIADELPLVFPVHPRTRGTLERLGLDLGPHVHLMDPQPYMAFLHLWKHAALVLTDSGGLQEETTALGVPCVTIRENTERPITVDEGSNRLAGTDPARIVALARESITTGRRALRRPDLWDGRAAERIVDVLAGALRARA
ncbi:MAG: UDP-N-acetylglucosamine 2-epimerase (non-hydrolyzing), partial [Rubrivivax sp.]